MLDAFLLEILGVRVGGSVADNSAARTSYHGAEESLTVEEFCTKMKVFLGGNGYLVVLHLPCSKFHDDAAACCDCCAADWICII